MQGNRETGFRIKGSESRMRRQRFGVMARGEAPPSPPFAAKSSGDVT